MAFYSNSAFGPPQKFVPRLGTQTQPNYLFGSFDFKTEPYIFQVTNVTVASNVAIVAGTLLRGGGGTIPNNAPQAGAKIGIRGTTTNGGIFNVDPTIATTVTWTASTGAISVTFPLTHADVATAPDTGTLVVNQVEIPDVPIILNSASSPLALIFTPDESDNSRCLFAEVRWFGTIPSAATVVLQVSNVDDDGYGATPVSRWQIVENAYGTAPGGTVAASSSLATIAGSAVTQSGAMYQFLMGKFIRAKVTALTGADSTTGLVVSVFA